MRKIIRNTVGGYDYFLVKPAVNGDAHKSALRLMEIDRVREVAITEGAYGFVVRAEQDGNRKKLGKELAKAVGGSSTKAVCYCQYVK